MSQHTAIPINDLEETAQGHDLFRAPGQDLLLGQAREQARASGWLPAEVAGDWPSDDTYRGIVARRQDLYDAMRRLEATAARASGLDDWAEAISDALALLQTALERHVAETEAPDGLFVEVLERAPHLTSRIEGLRKEHVDLLSSCRTAIDLVSGESDVAHVRRRVLGILGNVIRHRQRGSELLFDTYNVDLAAGN